MKKVVVFIALVFLTISMVSALDIISPGFREDVILRLSSETNAHAQTVAQADYEIEILYSDIFGSVSSGGDSLCTGENTILKLSAETNAHAEGPEGTNYNTEVCYGDLSCFLYEIPEEGAPNCPPVTGGPMGSCVVKLSDTTNAHLETCDNSNYNYSICCFAGGGIQDCESLTTKNQCWELGESCTWTPPFNSTGGETLTNADGGGCCPDNRTWYGGVCIESSVGMCYNIWAVDNQVLGTTYKLSGTTWQYCAQVTSGLNYGFWYDINKF